MCVYDIAFFRQIMSAKRKIKGGESSSKRAKKNGKRKGEDDLSDFDDEFQSDLSNDGSAIHSSNEDGNEVDDLPADDNTLVSNENINMSFT